MQPSQRVILELEDGASPIQGWVAADDGRRARFDGYVQLIGQLEAVQRMGATQATDAGGLQWPGSGTD